jgi:hypothetical protein
MQRFCVAVNRDLIEFASLGGRMMFYLGYAKLLSGVEYPCTDEHRCPMYKDMSALSKQMVVPSTSPAYSGGDHEAAPLMFILTIFPACLCNFAEDDR